MKRKAKLRHKVMVEKPNREIIAELAGEKKNNVEPSIAIEMKLIQLIEILYCSQLGGISIYGIYHSSIMGIFLAFIVKA